MPQSHPGVFAAALTPLFADLTPDHSALIRHCRWLLANGCDGLAVLGTTGEANSFSVEERLAILDALGESGLPGRALLPGTGCCAIPDTVRLSRRAIEIGARGVLVLPPFYYKNVSDDGVYASFAGLIEGVKDDRLRLYLYHFPQMSAVPISHAVIERLRADFPGIIAGIKDSSGDLDNMLTMIRRFPGFQVLAGADHLLKPVLEAGGAGCITAVANIAAPLAARVFQACRQGGGDAQAHDLLCAVRTVFAGQPLSAALKEVLARASGNPGWRPVRPPMMSLSPAKADGIMARLAAIPYAPPPL